MLVHIAEAVTGRRPTLNSGESKALLEFCRSVGAASFTANFLFVKGEESEALMEQFYKRLESFSMGEAVLENLGGAGFTKQLCWALHEQSIEFILNETRGDLFAFDPLRLPEDWVFYVGDAILLQVVSHEKEATLRLSEGQYAGFRRLGLVHGQGCPEWSGLPEVPLRAKPK